MSEPALTVERLSYRYAGATRDSLTDVDLRVEPGEFVVLAGRSASGKTTLLRACCGLVPHFHGGVISGSVAVTGLETREHGPGDLARAVGYVAQDPETQVVSTTVAAELELALELRGEPPTARARAVEEAALALAIPHLLPRAVDTLSGGELQRVALAAALVTRPALVLLDEPTSQLDPVAGDELIWLLRRLNEEWGTAVVLSEHRLERCLGAADRVVAMRECRIAFDGAPADFLFWSLESEPALATPLARAFSTAGITPLPTGVKEARALLREHPTAEIRAASSAGGGGSRFRTAISDAGRKRFPGQEPRPRGGSPPFVPSQDPRPSGKDPVLQTRDMWVALDPGDGPRDVLRGVELRLGAGERVALMGRNGAGKSTLLRAIAGTLEPVRGSVATPAGSALLGQDPGDYLVRERVADELPGEDGRRALRLVGLEGLGESDPRDLSGGQRQRLALAIVLAGRNGDAPGIVCLDEPTRGMDRGLKDDLGALIGDLTDRGAAVLVATHDVEFAAGFADRVVLLGDGEPIADGPADEVLGGGWYFATELARAAPGP